MRIQGGAWSLPLQQGWGEGLQGSTLGAQWGCISSPEFGWGRGRGLPQELRSGGGGRVSTQRGWLPKSPRVPSSTSCPLLAGPQMVCPLLRPQGLLETRPQGPSPSGYLPGAWILERRAEGWDSFLKGRETPAQSGHGTACPPGGEAPGAPMG